MKLRDKKVWGIPLVLVIIFIGIGITVASAAIMYTLSLPATIIIKETVGGTYKIIAYSDLKCTSVLTTLDFVSYSRSDGESSYIIFYVKNVGTASVGLTFESSDFGYSLYWSNVRTDESFGTLSPNDIAEVQIKVKVRADEEKSGTINFTINIYAVA